MDVWLIKLFLELFVSGCEMSTGTMMYGVPNGKRAWQKCPLHGSMLRGCDLFMTSTPVHDEKKTLGWWWWWFSSPGRYIFCCLLRLESNPELQNLNYLSVAHLKTLLELLTTSYKSSTSIYKYFSAVKLRMTFVSFT